MTETAVHTVTGLTCQHCVTAVTEEVSALPGVREVQVDLVPSGRSSLRVTSETPVAREDLAAAVHEAGDDYEIQEA